MSQTVESKEFIYEFENFVLDPNERILLADGKPVHLTDKVFDTLLLLIQHNGRLVTKDEMMASIWDESFVEEGNLAKNISRLRKILNVNGSSMIETLPRRGYRFAADVKEIDGETSLLIRRNIRVKITQTTDDEENGRRGDDERIKQVKGIVPAQRRSRVPMSVAAALLLTVFAGLGFYFWRSNKRAQQDEAGMIRLTNDPRHETNPVWTSDGRIRFIRLEKDKPPEAMIMNADGSEQTVRKELANMEWGGYWSPNGSKVLFAKRGDKTALYLANADGSNETALPFFGNMDWSADSKQIVYQKSDEQNKNSELFVYSIDTQEIKNVTNSPAFDADPSFSPDGKQIVFASTRDGNVEIYLMNADGSNVRRLTNHPAWDSHPFFSPDGTNIAFPSDRDAENADVYVMNTDGSNIRRLTDWESNESVAPGGWSPDGTRLVLYSDRHGNDDIYVMSAEFYRPEIVLADDESNLTNASYSPDGKKIMYQAELPDKSGELRIYDTETKQTRVLMKTENANLTAAFSPDGSQIVFQNKIGNNTEVCSIQADGSGFVNLTNNEWKDGGPTFSPDGKQIVFSTNRDGNTAVFNLYIMNSDGSDQRLIRKATGTMIVSPVFSPDGASIMFSDDFDSGGNFEIFKIRSDALNETTERLTFRSRHDGYPAVSPDGSRVAFTSNTDGNNEIYVMNSDGSGQLRLTRNAANDTMPQFSKDGKKVIFSSDRGGKYALYEIRLTE